jgi:hypothetical protein
MMTAMRMVTWIKWPVMGFMNCFPFHIVQQQSKYLEWFQSWTHLPLTHQQDIKSCFVGITTQCNDYFYETRCTLQISYCADMISNSNFHDLKP